MKRLPKNAETWGDTFIEPRGLGAWDWQLSMRERQNAEETERRQAEIFASPGIAEIVAGALPRSVISSPEFTPHDEQGRPIAWRPEEKKLSLEEARVLVSPEEFATPELAISMDQSWTQKYWPATQQEAAYRAAAARAPSPPPPPPSQVVASGITGTYAQLHPQKLNGFGDTMEQTFKSLGDALKAMDSDYSQGRITRRGPHQAHYAEDGAEYVEDAEVSFYPDETKINITQVRATAPSTTSIPQTANATVSDQSTTTQAAVAQSYQPTGDSTAVNASGDSVAASLTESVNAGAAAVGPAATTLAQKFNALDNTSKAVVAGALLFGAKSYLPSLLRSPGLMYLGVAAYLISKNKKNQGA